jgi:hypothetical protein
MVFEAVQRVGERWLTCSTNIMGTEKESMSKRSLVIEIAPTAMSGPVLLQARAPVPYAPLHAESIGAAPLYCVSDLQNGSAAVSRYEESREPNP